MQITTLAGALMLTALLVPTMCKGGDGPMLSQAVLDKVDPKHQLTEGQRRFAALSAIWQYHNSKGEPEKAKRAAGAMLQQYRIDAGHYAALARAAENGKIDDAVHLATKAYANVPDGRGLKLENRNGTIIATGTDEATGKTISKKVLSPQEFYGAISKIQPHDFDRAITEAAGERYEAEPLKSDEPIPTGPSRVRPPRQTEILTGTGVIVTAEGHALTNAHVVENCQQIWARTSEGSKASAGILAKSPADDLAVLKIKSSVRIPAVLRVAPSLRMGEPIIVYGFPMSGLLNSSGNATTGDISALAGIQNRASWLQISAPVQPGNSGGPLLDMYANVVGIVVAKLDALRIASSMDDIPQNVNFAIKASVAQNFLDAHNIRYSLGETTWRTLSVPDVVERAKAFSIEVTCQR